MIEMVEIVNPNGRKGKVAATSKAAQLYRQPPSAQRDAEPAPTPELPVNLGPAMPAKNAKHELWIAYATDPRTPNGLSSEDAEQMSRDELVDHFNTSEED